MRGTSRYPIRARNKAAYLGEYVVKSVVDNTLNHTVDYCYRTNDIPTCYSEAVSSPDATNWKRAMDNEIDTLINNETYILIPPPPNREIVGGNGSTPLKQAPTGRRPIRLGM